MRKLFWFIDNNRGFLTTGAIIAGAAIVGAGVVAGSAISSQGQKEASKTAANAQQAQINAEQQAAADAQAQRDIAVEKKQAAVDSIKYPTYLSTPEAQSYKTTLEDRMAGRGLIDVNAETSPIAAQLRAGLKNQTLPLQNAMASSRGLGRSTIPVNQGVQASQAAERDIAERMATLELARQEQIGQAVGQFGTLSEQEAASQQNKAAFERGGEFSVADTISGNADAARNEQWAIADTIKNKGMTEASYQLRQSEIWASAITGLSKSAAGSTEDIIGAIEKQQAANKNLAMVNTGSNSGFGQNSFNAQGIGFRK